MIVHGRKELILYIFNLELMFRDVELIVSCVDPKLKLEVYTKVKFHPTSAAGFNHPNN